jgi:NH3-dependent NAD+ synthetase
LFEDKELADETVRAVEKQINHSHAEGEVLGVSEKVETTTTERAV